MFATAYEQANVTFSSADGKFTAQVKGAYYFDLLLECENQSASDNTRLTFGFDVKKGAAAVQRRETYACPESTSSNQAQQFGFQTIVTLDVGDWVQLRVYGNGGGAQIYSQGTSHYNVFLISAFT